MARSTPQGKNYYEYLYRNLLKEIRNGVETSIPKWKKDVLVIIKDLSLRSEPQKKRVRKTVLRDVERACVLAYRRQEIYEEKEEEPQNGNHTRSFCKRRSN